VVNSVDLLPQCRTVKETIYIDPKKLTAHNMFERVFEVTCRCRGFDAVSSVKFEKFFPSESNCEPSSWKDEKCGIFRNFERLNQGNRLHTTHMFDRSKMAAIFYEPWENDTGIYRCAFKNWNGENGILFRLVWGYEHNETVLNLLQHDTLRQMVSNSSIRDSKANVSNAIGDPRIPRILWFTATLCSILLTIGAIQFVYDNREKLTQIELSRVNSRSQSVSPVQYYVSSIQTASTIVTEV